MSLWMNQVRLKVPEWPKHTNLSLHFLFFQFNQRQPREVHHTCEHIRAARVTGDYPE